MLSDSTDKRDRGITFQDYAAHGVSEYWIVDAEEKPVEQYVLQQGTYELKLKSNSGMITSVAIADFSIPIAALFDENINLQTLRQLLQT